jgi:hypothetical protein
MKNYFRQNFPEHTFYMSPNLGDNPIDNRGKEQYGFLVKKQYTPIYGSYPDPNHIFPRPPYYVYIKEYDIYLATIHTSPSNKNYLDPQTRREVIELRNFFNSVPGDMILLGDLNVCYPGLVDNEDIRKNFEWILDDNDKTNVNNDCAYDRIITQKSVVRYSDASVIRNQDVSNLDLSDHYPISISVF